MSRVPAQNDIQSSGSPTLAPAVPPLPSAAVNWTCRAAPAEGGTGLDQLSVGAKFRLTCEGKAITPWTSLPAITFAREDLAFSLVPLEMLKAEAGRVELIVTGYKPGQYSESFILGLGQNFVRVSKFDWKINSVVQAQEGKPPEPYPPFGPLMLHWPWWLWVGIGASIFLVALLIYWRVRRAASRRRLLEQIRAMGTALAPYAQFHKELRALMRRYEGRAQVDEQHQPMAYLADLNRSFRHYLARELMVPATEWSDAAIIRDIRRRHRRLYKQSGADLVRLLRELRRAETGKALSFTDCFQLHEMSRAVAERIEGGKESRS